MTPAQERIAAEFRSFNEAFRPAYEHLQRAAGEMVRVMGEFAKTPAGQQLLALAELKKQDPERFEQVMAAHRAAMSQPSCHCFCQRWGHLGTCDGRAVTDLPITSEVTGRVQVPMCRPCADAVMAVHA